MKLKHKMRGSSEVGFIFYLIAFVFILIVEIGFGMMVSEKSAVDAARVNGFSDIKVIDKAIVFMSWRGCSRADDARFTVQAVNARGEQVEFYVCSSWLFKGSTIRTK